MSTQELIWPGLCYVYIYIFISYSRYISNKQIKYTNNPQFRIAMELAEVQSIQIIQTYLKIKNTLETHYISQSVMYRLVRWCWCLECTPFSQQSQHTWMCASCPQSHSHSHQTYTGDFDLHLSTKRIPLYEHICTSLAITSISKIVPLSELLRSWYTYKVLLQETI